MTKQSSPKHLNVVLLTKGPLSAAGKSFASRMVSCQCIWSVQVALLAFNFEFVLNGAVSRVLME